MLVPFEELSENARLWIYQADKKLSEVEIEVANSVLLQFVESWAAHGAPLKASYKIYHSQFIALSVDESYNQASGCSIDSSVHIIKQLEQQLNINFFDRTKLAFIFNDEVYLESLSNLKSKVESGQINEDTLIFNNMVSTKGDLDKAWVVPAKNSWVKRYFG